MGCLPIKGIEIDERGSIKYLLHEIIILTSKLGKKSAKEYT